MRKKAMMTFAFLLVVAIFGLNAVAQTDASQASTSTSSTTTKKSKKAKSSDANAGTTKAAPSTVTTTPAAPSGTTASTTSTTSTSTASTTSKSSTSKTSTKAPVQAQTPPQPGMVWVNTASGTYHKSGRWYGKTKEGKFMTEADAVKAGYKPAKD